MTKKIKFRIIVVGSGGTGTYVLKEFARYISGNTPILQKIEDILIVDGDTIEKKNLSRQAFTIEDVGYNKALVMANILNENFNLHRFHAVAQYLTTVEQLERLSIPKNHDSEDLVIPLIIGCVDNHAARLICEQFFYNSENCFYFDSANEHLGGQCIYSVRLKNVTLGPCRSEYFPDMLEGDLRNVNELSCEELNNTTPQHILANMNSGLCLLVGMVELLETGKKIPSITFFDPFGGYAENCTASKYRFSNGKNYIEQ